MATASNRRRVAGIALFLALFSGMSYDLSAKTSTSVPEYVPGQVLVKFRSLPSGLDASIEAASYAVLPGSVQTLLARHQITGLKRIFSDLQSHSSFQHSMTLGKTVAVPDLYGWCSLSVSSGTDIVALAREISKDPNVSAASPNYIAHISDLIPNDPGFPQQWHHKNTGQNGGQIGADIKSTFIWPLVTGSTSVIVAILDTGIDANHADLVQNLVPGFNFVANNTATNDDEGHGTHVAGIIGARGNNSTAVTGIMWQSSLMPIKVCDASGSCDLNTAALGIRWATDHGARVINMSFGGPQDTPSLDDAIAYATSLGVVLVAAAGNDGAETINYPAGNGNVLGIAATDESDRLASFSTFGRWIALSAPGNNIVSTFFGNSTATLSGTSMASPMVAGAAGLILSRFPTLSVQDIKNRLLRGVDVVDALNPTFAGKMGTGRLNLLKATEVIPTVSAINTTVTPNNSYVQNGSLISFTASVSSDIAPPQITVSLIDQNNRPLTTGITFNYSVTNQVSVTGTAQLGSLTLNYPLAAQVKLRFTLNDGIFINTIDAAVFTVNEQAIVPLAESAAVYNPIINPAQGNVATIRLVLPAPGHVNINIYTPNGTRVKTLANQDIGVSGVQTWDWAAVNDQGSTVASGLYLIQISAPGINATKKAIVVK